MREMSAWEVARDLGVLPGPTESERRLEVLTKVVLDLMTEVEALRETIATGSRYRDAYRNSALLVHNNSGPSTGWDKLLDCFYPHEETSEGRMWRELLMMRRLGFTSTEIETYQRKAEEVEMYS